MTSGEQLAGPFAGGAVSTLLPCATVATRPASSMGGSPGRPAAPAPSARRGPHRTGLNGAAGPDATDNTAVEAEIAWAVETSRDGERWHFFGKAWTRPGEPLLVHGLPRFVRYRRLDGDRPWSAPLERSGSAPLTLLRLDEQAREELWPGRQHAGLPVLLPPGEEGRLLRFERSSDGESFSWSLEFRGRLRGSAESRLGRTTR
jgi:hypothetical protein